MIIDRHTHAGRPRRTGDVDRSVLATMREAAVENVRSGHWPLVFRAVPG